MLGTSWADKSVRARAICSVNPIREKIGLGVLRRPPLPIFNKASPGNSLATTADFVSRPATAILKGPVVMQFSTRRVGEPNNLWASSASHCVLTLPRNRRIPCLYVAVFGLVSVCQLGCVATQSAPAAIAPSTSGGHAAHASTGYTLETPIEVIAADPGGAAVLTKYMPALLANPNYSSFKAMNLKWLASMSRGKLSQQTLAQIEADLEALPKQVAGDQ
jgi:hypothetical protein